MGEELLEVGDLASEGGLHELILMAGWTVAGDPKDHSRPSVAVGITEDNSAYHFVISGSIQGWYATEIEVEQQLEGSVHKGGLGFYFLVGDGRLLESLGDSSEAVKSIELLFTEMPEEVVEGLDVDVAFLDPRLRLSLKFPLMYSSHARSKDASVSTRLDG
ncbi:hypothetical protein FOZ62_014383, partial [Perkinsus olseni]